MRKGTGTNVLLMIMKTRAKTVFRHRDIMAIFTSTFSCEKKLDGLTGTILCFLNYTRKNATYLLQPVAPSGLIQVYDIIAVSDCCRLNIGPFTL